MSVLDRAAPPPDLTVPYGPLAEHVVDLRLPRDLPAPLIVLIHGGFWRPAYDRTHLGPMGHALAAAGYVVAVPDHDGGGRDRPPAWYPWRAASACGCARNGTWARARPPT